MRSWGSTSKRTEQRRSDRVKRSWYIDRKGDGLICGAVHTAGADGRDSRAKRVIDRSDQRGDRVLCESMGSKEIAHQELTNGLWESVKVLRKGEATTRLEM